MKRSLASLALGVLVGLCSAGRADDAPKTFATPEEGLAALIDAAQTTDWAALRSLFGLATDDVVAADRVQATNELHSFVAACGAGHWLTRDSATRCVVEVGLDRWPFPIPLVQQNGRWQFDTAAGKDELLNRLIGRNEIEVLKVARAYVEAQRAYASRDRDGDEVLEYAQHLASAAGTKDGLYWPPDLDGELSPFGPLVARARAEGYRVRARSASPVRSPFHGYYFKILTAQGSQAPGGNHSYIINGNMIAGFALVAWPADYGESGIMTFIVNQQGRVYQRDLGPKTARLAANMTRYDPGPGWALSRE